MDREERGMELDSAGPGLKLVVTIIGLAFAITLAVMIGKNMSAEAMAIVIGIVCAVLVSLPPLLILLITLLRRDRNDTARKAHQEESRAMPPIIVVQGGAPQALPPGMPSGYWPMAAPGMSPDRSFQVVGGDDLLEGEWTAKGREPFPLIERQKG